MRADCGNSFESREVMEYISQLPMAQQEIAQELRHIVLAAAPKISESIKWGKPWFSSGGLICYIAVQKNYINFGFARGAELSDPRELLEGSGAGMRHVKVHSLRDINRKQFSAWVKAAAALCEGAEKAAR